MKNFTIGILGGMGTYATIHLFQQYVEVFPAKKEWERPRIVIDNRCTMPSRVRAFIYNEKVEELVEEMTDSLQHLMIAGCTRIILACNTSHLFLPQIYERIPELEHKIVHIIYVCVNEIAKTGAKSIYLLGSEGTIDSEIYQKALLEKKIKCITPKPEEYSLLRDCIEAVKKNQYTDEVKQEFLDLINRHDACILGCTELPILFEKYASLVNCRLVFDPLLLAIKKLKTEYDDE